ncbi:MAG: hypothetical protein AB8U25_06370 [Rickettsiales endosymbiont of Dermacentor nuttalli]
MYNTIERVVHVSERIAEFKDIEIICNSSINFALIKVGKFKMEQTIFNLVKMSVDYISTHTQINIHESFDSNSDLVMTIQSIGTPFEYDNTSKILSLAQNFNHINNLEENDIILLLAHSFIKLHGAKLNLRSKNNTNKIELILPANRVII